MIDTYTAVDAERFRRRHCDNPGGAHQCHGVVKISPGMCHFDCKLCGTEHVLTVNAMDQLDAIEHLAQVPKT